MNSDTFDDGGITLPNGCHLHIRALRHGEDGPVRELFARLSPRTRYLRFHSPTTVLTDSLVRTLVEVNDPRRLALVAEAGSVEGGDVVGLANVVAGDDGRGEIGVVVADAWQRRGIGATLAARLLHAAELCGFHRFVIHGLWANPALRPLLNHIAEVVSIHTRLGVSEITFVRRRSAVSTRGPHGSKTPFKDPREQAYERILAAQGRRDKW